MWTDAGLRWLFEMGLGLLRNEDGGLTDELAKGRIVVGDGDAPESRADTRLAGELTAQASISSYELVATDVGIALVVTADFPEGEALFDWRERGFVTAQGVLLERTVEDGGRKGPTALWTAEATLELVTLTPE